MKLPEISSLRTSRRSVLKAVGASVGGLVGMAGSASARGRGNGNGKPGRGNGDDNPGRRNNENGNGDRRENRGRRQLEDTPSTLAVYFPDHEQLAAEELMNAIHDGTGFFDPGVGFDTTDLVVTGNGNRIHHELPFPGAKPYVLAHEGDGLYTDRGAVINFELDEEDVDDLPLPPELAEALRHLIADQGVTKFRAAVSEYIQLYGKGKYFNWSVTRVDIFARPGMNYISSAFIVLWDENDGSVPDRDARNDDQNYRTDLEGETPAPPPAGKAVDPHAAFDTDTPEADWAAIKGRFLELAGELAEGEPNPGGN